jgi:hypothetical protein
MVWFACLKRHSDTPRPFQELYYTTMYIVSLTDNFFNEIGFRRLNAIKPCLAIIPIDTG